jgi:hypothetical protein
MLLAADANAEEKASDAMDVATDRAAEVASAGAWFEVLRTLAPVSASEMA